MWKVLQAEETPYGSHKEFTWQTEGSFQMQLLCQDFKECRDSEKTCSIYAWLQDV
jgi:hypothetical protein